MVAIALSATPVKVDSEANCYLICASILFFLQCLINTVVNGCQGLSVWMN